MNIPNDLGGDWRLNKFVEYQHYAPAIDPLTYVEYAKRNLLDWDECVELAWFHSLTYCEITAAFLLEKWDCDTDIKKFWYEHKNSLIFGSARKYVKNMDWFIPLMERFLDEIEPRPYSWLEEIAGQGTPEQKYKSIEKYLGKWKYMGRFSIDLFTEALIAMGNAGLIPLKIENAGYDWSKTSNLTSGMLNIFYLDDKANQFDKGELKLYPADYDYLDRCLYVVLDKVKEVYPKQEVDDVSVVNKICSFRNLFKKARYGGFHHDRQLGNLLEYQKSYPGYPLWEKMFIIREYLFPPHMLGEYNGWKGIRTKRKKLWVEEGLTGVERDAL